MLEQTFKPEEMKGYFQLLTEIVGLPVESVFVSCVCRKFASSTSVVETCIGHSELSPELSKATIVRTDIALVLRPVTKAQKSKRQGQWILRGSAIKPARDKIPWSLVFYSVLSQFRRAS